MEGCSRGQEGWGWGGVSRRSCLEQVVLQVEAGGRYPGFDACVSRFCTAAALHSGGLQRYFSMKPQPLRGAWRRFSLGACMHAFVSICNMARTSIRPTARKCIDASGPGTSYKYVFLSRAVVWRYVRVPGGSVGGSTPCSLKKPMFRVGNAESYVFVWMLGSLASCP